MRIFGCYFRGFLCLLTQFFVTSAFAQPSNMAPTLDPTVRQNIQEISDADAALNWRLFIGCENRVAESCLRFGQKYLTGEGVEQSDDKARDFMYRACNLYSAIACKSIAENSEPYILISDIPYARADFYGYACTYGDFESCNKATEEYSSMTTFPSHLTRAAHFAKIGCLNNIAVGCGQWGKFLIEQRPNGTALLDGTRLLRRACQMDDKPSCELYRNHRARDDNSRCTMPNTNAIVKFQFNVESAYPPSAVAAEIEGRVDAIVHVNATGNVTKVDIENSTDEGVFDAAVRAEAMNMKFFSATNCSNKIPSTYNLRVEFKLYD